MADRSKRSCREKTKLDCDHQPNPSNSPTKSSSENEEIEVTNPSRYRNWSDLPQHLLHSILYRVSIPDLLSFAAISRHFLFAATDAASPSSAAFPPLLLNPVVSLPCRHQRVRWSHPSRYRLQTLISGPTKPYLSPLSSRSLPNRYFCIGHSHCHLIFALPDENRALLADVFTGGLIRSAKFPSGYFDFSFGILTGPPLMSSSCRVLVVARNKAISVDSIMCWQRPGSGTEWLVLQLWKSSRIISLVTLKGRVFALDSFYRFLLIEFVGPKMIWRMLGVQLAIGRSLCYRYGSFGRHLVECDGELLIVFFTPTVDDSCNVGMPKMVVYKLDLEKSVWMEKQDLGDWCLFVDAVGQCGFSCRDPVRWGGRKNCVYVAGPGVDGWRVLPLDGEAIDTNDDEIPLCPRYMKLPRWPSPIWVYPRMPL